MTDNTNLKSLLKPNSVTEREGIFVDKYIADKTVWDKLAVESPEHAVISASSEEAVAEKSVDQITELKVDLPEGIILDLGCGYGRIAKYLLPQRSFSGYIGVDSAHEMVRLFAARYNQTPAEQTTPVMFVNADIHMIPLQDSSVDSVVVAAVFLHNHKSVVKRSLDEIYRVLKPGGVMYVYGSFPNKWSLMGLQGMIYQMFLNLIGNPFKNGPVRYYARGEVADLLDSFSEINIRSVG
ncbi:class I SAM-dependent methyltransferase, partial [Candidatus Kaiserbacteria bacterium]|nr:class I SAM-dependent methyltransferase [Candidatus Kaiserbacteria bacterium]